MTGETGLRRAVSRWELVGLAVNSVVGSAVYLLPAAIAALLGTASLWAVPLAGIVVGFLVLCFAEAGSRFDQPGGAYLYTREAFGEFVGFEVGWITYLARIGSGAALAAGFAQALGFVWPGAGAGWIRALVIAGPLVAYAAINVSGVEAGARATVGLVVAKVVPILALLGVGVFAVSWDRVVSVEAAGVEGLGEAVLLLLFAYAGFEIAPAAAGEYEDPERDVPFALLTMIGGVTLLYLLVQLVTLGVVPDLAGSTTPLADAAGILVGGWAGVAMTGAAAVSIQGSISGNVLLGPRFLYALAIDGYGPRALTSVHAEHRTPWVVIVVHTAAVVALAVSGSFVQLALLSMIARLGTYVGTAAAVPILRRKMADTSRTVRLPGGPTIPIAALLLCTAFLASTSVAHLVAGASALAVGVPIYVLRRDPVERGRGGA